jgi:hypothetical protein
MRNALLRLSFSGFVSTKAVVVDIGSGGRIDLIISAKSKILESSYVILKGRWSSSRNSYRVFTFSFTFIANTEQIGHKLFYVLLAIYHLAD